MNDIHTGIDKRGEKLFMARVKIKGGRPLVDMLTQCDDFQSALVDGGNDSNVSWAVPDSEAIIKSLYLPNTDSINHCEAGRFELLQSLLDSEDNYVTTVIPTKISNLFLGIAWHKDCLSSVCQVKGNQTESNAPIFQSRALALGRGFLGFCRTGEGELKVIVDVASDTVSFCIIYNKQVVDIGCISANSDLFANDKNIDRFGIDLKTLLNYKLSLLAGEGITIPLSALIISGHGVDEKARNILTTYFPVGVLSPDIHRGYFTSKIIDTTPYLSDYLVALGLTTN